MPLTRARFNSTVDSTAGAGPWVAPSWTPAANKLYVAFVSSWYNSTTPIGTHGLSGWSGLATNWTQINTIRRAAGVDPNQSRTTAFYCVTGASPTGGSLSVSCTTNADDVILELEEIDGFDATTQIVQSVTGDAASAASIALTLAALGSANNGVLIGGHNYNGAAAQSGSGYTLSSSDVDATDAFAQGVSYKFPGDTSPVLTFAGSGPLAAIAIEIKAAASGTTFEVALALAARHALTAAAAATRETAVALGARLGLTPAALATLEAALVLGERTGLVAAANADLFAAAALGARLTLLASNGQTIESALALGFRQGLSAAAQRVAEASLALGHVLAQTLAAQATLNAGVTLSHALAVSLLAGAVREAGLTLGAVHSITASGSTVTAVVVTPDGRIITILFDDRAIVVRADDRTIEIPASDRTITIH